MPVHQHFRVKMSLSGRAGGCSQFSRSRDHAEAFRFDSALAFQAVMFYRNFILRFT